MFIYMFMIYTENKCCSERYYY